MNPEDLVSRQQLELPERRLYQAIIQQAVLDAKMELPEARGDKDSESRRRIVNNNRDKARTWLTTPTSWFLEVCHYAGLDAQAVLDAARRMQAKGWK